MMSSIKYGSIDEEKEAKAKEANKEPSESEHKLSRKARIERARGAIQARWRKQEETEEMWEFLPLPEAEQLIHELRDEIERGAAIVAKRYDTSKEKYVPCFICEKDIQNGHQASTKAIRNPETQILQNIFFCSAVCVARYQKGEKK